ncbi:MAG: PKD repeat protein [Sphingobacteriales bacterium]
MNLNFRVKTLTFALIISPNPIVFYQLTNFMKLRNLFFGVATIVCVCLSTAKAQDQLTVNATLSGTITIDDAKTDGDVEVISGQSLGYLLFPLNLLEEGRRIQSVQITGFINSTSSTPETGNFYYDLSTNPSEAVFYEDAKSGNFYANDIVWQFGQVTAQLNDRAITDIENKAGSYLAVGVAPNEASTQRFNWIGYGNSVYGADLIITFEPEGTPTPKADFTADTRDIVVGETVTFTDASENGPTSWGWDFNVDNDPGVMTSTDQNPSMTFPVPGQYSVQLNISDGTNDDSKTRVNYITVYETPKSGFDHNIFVGSTGVQFNDTSSKNPTSWFWEFGDPDFSTSDSRNPFFVYPDSGYFTVCLTTTNLAGSDTACNTIIIGDSTGATGISNAFATANVNLFPNPANTFINLSWSNKVQPTQVVIRDIAGRILSTRGIELNSTSKIINLEDLNSGYYLIELSDETSVIGAKRFIKN